MISKITLNKVASYKTPTVLETDKKANLIYGLNGTGKSIFSNFLYVPNDLEFKDCSIEGLNDDEILVYNQKFIEENFFESDDLKGIFTLSKTNKEAEQNILNAKKEVERLKGEKDKKEEESKKKQNELSSKRNDIRNKIWQIKTKYSGGDRVLEYCLEGYKSSGDKLLDHVLTLDKPEIKPAKTIAELKIEVQSLAGEDAQKYSKLTLINIDVNEIENAELFQAQIVGNENSTIAKYINELQNSDWVKLGIKYIPEEIGNENAICPFCQEKTISTKLLENIKDYFDESYEADLKQLNEYLTEYSDSIELIPDKSVFESNPKIESFKKDFELKYNSLTRILFNNKKQIEEKLKSPSISMSLKSSLAAVKELNTIIESVNKLVDTHNDKIDNKAKTLKELKEEFWKIMRWEYDPDIMSYNSYKSTIGKDIELIDKLIQGLDALIKKQGEIITEQQKLTVNIEESISNINKGLIDLGIEDFYIKKYSENLYKIARKDNDSKIFKSLSEGEKMVISFLYFIELCRGKKSATDLDKDKIIVIDDPISSLSHIYIFNIGRLIHDEFLRSSKYEQIFILTHSLYFFYELADMNEERRHENQKLFRLRKNSDGSEIIQMKYEEIQNDYHSYWFIIKDEKHPPALIANCMRNIIEYFFNFVEKRNVNEVFQKPALQENKYQAFNRYINRESHSLGQNIFDIKEFNYDDFKDAFELVFKLSDYEAHYKRMMR